MICCVNKKTIIRVLIIAVVAVLALSILIGCVTANSQAVLGKNARKLPVYAVDKGEEKVVALTFDAAWGADKTRKIIEIMNQNQATGTFFLVGFWIDKYAEEVKYIAENNFEIGNHSRNHLKMSTLSKEKIHKEISYVNTMVKQLTNKDCKVFRPPFGDYNDNLIENVNGMGMTPIQWDVDSLDWKGLSGDEINKRVLPKVKNGSIVLFHNNSDHVLDALPNILAQLTKQGYKFVTVSQLLYKENYGIDNNGVQYQLKK